MAVAAIAEDAVHRHRRHRLDHDHSVEDQVPQGKGAPKAGRAGSGGARVCGHGLLKAVVGRRSLVVGQFATTSAFPLSRYATQRERSPHQKRPSVYIPPADFNDRFCAAQSRGAIAGRHFSFFAGQQGNIIVFPDHRHNFVSARALVDFQPDKEREVLAWILERDMRD